MMSRIIQIRLADAVDTPPGTSRWYGIARHTLVSDTPLPDFAAYEMNPVLTGLQPVHVKMPGGPGFSRLAFEGPAWIGHRYRQVTCRWLATGCWLEVDGAGLFWIAADGGSLARISSPPGTRFESMADTALGPALILALALQGTWCLHASAVVSTREAIAFVGESGRGKSTLAQFLGEQENQGWTRVADDILPVTVKGDRVTVLPRFPQLKLSGETQAPADVDGLPLQAVYLLDGEGDEGADPRAEALSLQHAALILVRHTVAAPLFDAVLLAEHAAFCAQAAKLLQVRRLEYRRDRRNLPDVGQLVSAEMLHRPPPAP